MELPVKCYSNATVGDFVPFYFCPRSVMLYVIHKANNPELAYKGGQGPIVHLQCDLNKVIAALDKAKRSWAFSGSNAGAVYSSFWNDPSKLSQLDWSHIGAKSWQEPEVRDAKQAEFLVYKKISLAFGGSNWSAESGHIQRCDECDRASCAQANSRYRDELVLLRRGEWSNSAPAISSTQTSTHW
ncbi:DUF4433 domain-containing protein [Mesorhizobium sp. M2C.T.Ca.TU.009.01.2.1]|nr:DUF4433 domain-containing protein [Mesorhizobium sp. M2C.T.Ca.TU.009.01.2.1]